MARRPARHERGLRRQPRSGPARGRSPAAPVRHRDPVLAPHRLQPQHAAPATAERRATRAARSGDRRRRHPCPRRQHAPAAQQRRRAARADRTDRRAARPGHHTGDPAGRPQRPARRAGARTVGAALRRRVDARRNRRRLHLSRHRAQRPHRLRADHPGRRRDVRTHADLRGLRSPPRDRGPRAAPRARHPAQGVRPAGPPRRTRPGHREHARRVRATRSSSASPRSSSTSRSPKTASPSSRTTAASPAPSAATPAPAVAGDPEFPYVGNYIRNLTLAQVRTLACDKPLPQFPQQRVVPGARMPLLQRRVRARRLLRRAQSPLQHRDQGRGRRAAGDRAARAVRPDRRRARSAKPACSTASRSRASTGARSCACAKSSRACRSSR